MTGDPRNQTGLVRAVTDLKDREMCTTPEAYYVIKETRALIALHERVSADQKNAPHLDLAHTAAFVRAISYIARNLVETEFYTIAPLEVIDNDHRVFIEVAPLATSPLRAESDKEPQTVIEIDYTRLYGEYVCAILNGESPQDALESAALLLTGRIYRINGSANLTAGECCTLFMNKIREVGKADIASCEFIEQLRVLRISMLLSDLSVAFREYFPQLAEGPESRLQCASHTLYERSLNDKTLGRLEVDRKIALNLVRVSLEEVRIDEANRGYGYASSEDRAAIAFEMALKLARDEAQGARARLGEFQRYLSLPIMIIDCEKKLLARAQYYIRILTTNKDWITSVLSR